MNAPAKVGVDIVSVARVRRIFGRRSTSRLRSVFTATEIADCQARARPFEGLAARLAAKECFVKATGASALRPRDVVVVLDERGAPRLELHGAAGRVLRTLGLSQVALSLSHEREYAIACLLLT